MDPLGPYLSQESLFNFLWNLYILPWLWEIFKFMVLKLLENAFASQKIATSLPKKVLIITPKQREITQLAGQYFFWKFVFHHPTVERGGGNWLIVVFSVK